MASPKVQLLAHFFFLLYINDLPAALGDSAFLFADDVKIVYPRSQSSRLLSSLSPAWAWAEEWDLPINPNKCAYLTVGNLPPLSPRQTFSARTKPSSTKERCLFCPSGEILKQPPFPSSKNSWTVIGSKSSLQHLCKFCPHSLTILSVQLPQTIYVFT